MKLIAVAITLALSSLSAYADNARVPVKTIEMFAITNSSVLVLEGRTGSYIAPFTQCSMQSIKNMEKPNIFFPRPYVKPDTAVIVYDQENRKHTVRCNIERVVERDRMILASM